MSSVESNQLPIFLQEAASDEADVTSAERLAQLFEALGAEEQPDTALPAGLGTELLAQVSRGAARFAPFYRRVAELFQISEQQVEEILAGENWKRTPMPGIRYQDVPSPLNSDQLQASFVLFSPGTRYPHHNHRGEERVLLLQGGYTDDQGVVYEAGDWHEMKSGDAHGFVVHTDGPCLAASLADKKLLFSSPVLRALAKLVGR